MHLSPLLLSSLPPECVAKVNQLKALMPDCANKPRGVHRDEHFQRIALRLGTDADGKPLLSGERLRKWFAAFVQHGEKGLIDHRLCRGRCMDAECSQMQRQAAIPPALADEFFRRLMANKVVTANILKTMAKKQVHRDLMNDLRNGLALPGVGDWRAIWAGEHPHRATPARCPYTPEHPPRGLSYQSFAALRIPATALVAGQRSIAEARTILPEVRMNWATMRPQEFFIMDDVRLDWHIIGTFDGVPQRAELWALMIMDAATRTIRWAQVHPKWRRRDGSRTGISRREAQHCIAHCLLAHGLPKHWTTTMIVENATAAITPEFEDTLTRVSDGRILVKRTGLHDGRVLVGGFKEATGGNPHGMKAALESFWGKLHLSLGAVPGQIGADYRKMPGDTPRRLQWADAVLKKLGPIADDADLAKIIGLYDLPLAKQAILTALHELENRNDHNLTGFRRKLQWRWTESAEGWMDSDGPEAVVLLSQPHGHQIMDSILHNPACTREIMESPRDRWARLRKAEDYELFSDDAALYMWQDVVRGKNYRGDGRLVVNWMGEELTFGGIRHGLRAGDEWELRFDGDDPGRAIVCSRGLYMGTMDFIRRADPGDRAALERQLGDYTSGLSGAVAEVRRIAQPREQLLQQIAEVRERETLMQGLCSAAESVLQDGPIVKAAALAIGGSEAEAAALAREQQPEVSDEQKAASLAAARARREAIERAAEAAKALISPFD